MNRRTFGKFKRLKDYNVKMLKTNTYIMKTIKTIITALLLTAGMAAQAQQVMTVRTDNSNDKFQLTSRLVLDLTKNKPVVRTNSQTLDYASGTHMLVYLMPTSEDTYQIIDGTPSFYNPEDKFYKAITYTRNYQNTDWQLLYLPLRLEYSQWCENFDIARLNDIHQYDTDNDGQIDETYLEVVMVTTGCTEPNTPYVIRAHKAGNQTITQDGATLFASEQTEATVSNWDTYFTIRGNYYTKAAGELGENTFYAVEDNSLQMGSSAEGTLDAFRWFITVTDRNGKHSTIRRIHIFESQDAIDGIEELTPTLSKKEGEVYDLSGRKVQNPSKGVFIKNGRKMLVK